MNEVEKFEEVDKTDVPTGRLVTKQEAHGDKLVHRCVAVYVFDKSGKLYVQVHKASNGLLDHTVGGHVSAGEDYKTAALRETEEEVGIIGVELNEIATSYYSKERSHIHMFGIYECTEPRDWIFEPNGEVDEIIPMDLEEIVEQMNKKPKLYTGGFINTMKKYLEVKGIDMKVTVTL